MKYREINPEVFATQITVENHSLYSGKVGDFSVTHNNGKTEVISKEDFLKKYKPTLPMNDAKREMYRLCTEIIDKETLVDEDNAETLLAEACDLARELRKRIQ